MRSQNAMALTDGERRLIRVNPALAQLLGHKPSAMLGHHTYDYVIDGPLLSRTDWQQQIERGDVTGEVELRCSNGDMVRAQFGIHPENVTGHRLVLFVALTSSRWGRHFRRDAGEVTAELSNREREVLSMVAMGSTSPEIAEALHISHNTVRKHVN